ncbi:NAD(P)-dependent oxidoreductase [Veillonella sp.]|uniref:NAD(P)-dependent oxidoreductase n=1 Tax=Veillonella sp. TaxID=1926307 RepID=UPI001B457F2D|nr:NAD(P)-dependent oxidoreductase [Veillonella sp.]MBP8617019.1 NAD(P)-dependent oxidoreductase [Veillonella sp.]
MSNELKPLHFDQDYTMEEALLEAKRCLNCPKPLCQTGCPIDNQIPRFIHAIAQGNFGVANEILAERTNLPSICGRVCPRETQCEGNCIMNRMKKPPINIGKLERFAADFESINDLRKPKKIKQDNGRIAVIGSGPAGLSVAGDAAKLGYAVTVFEGQSEPGGILTFGIPDFRLSKSVVRREVARLEGLGVTFVCNTYIGVDKTIDDLFADGFDAVFIGTGTHIPQHVHMENDTIDGVFQAMHLLTNVQLVDNRELVKRDIPVDAGDRVVVIGAGNVAMDAARTCVRLGAKSVTVVYRRGQEQMPALKSEYEEALAEGVEFQFFASPVACIGEDKVTALRYELTKLTEDGTGIENIGEFAELEADKIILAAGHKPQTRLTGKGNNIEVNDSGYIVTVEEPYGMTSREGVFAGGDVVHKPATVVLAMREAKKAVDGMVKYIEVKKAEAIATAEK